MKLKTLVIPRKAKYQHTGLLGIIISSAIKNAEYAKRAVATEQEHIVPELSDKDEYRLQLQSDFDMAEEYLKEEERLQQKALKYRRMALGAAEKSDSSKS